MSDKELIREWVQNLRDTLTDIRQGGGSPEISDDGSKWRYNFMPKGVMHMDVGEIQALFRMFDLPELEPIKSNGDCGDCIHGHNVSSSSGLWPLIEDCGGCFSPTHPHFLPIGDVEKYNSIKYEDVFNIPIGGTIPTYFERIKTGVEGNWEYADTHGFCVRVKDMQRICHMDHLELLHIPGHKRHGRRERVQQ